MDPPSSGLQTIDNTDFRFHNDSDWTTVEGNGASNGQMHHTNVAGAKLTVWFNGSYVEVFGICGNVSGTGSPSTSWFSIDGTAGAPWNSSTSGIQKLYSSPMLLAGLHNLTISLQPANGSLSVDHVNFLPSATLGTSPGNATSSYSAHTSTDGGMNSAAVIAGTAIGALTGAVLTVLSVLWFLRRRRRRMERNPPFKPLYAQDEKTYSYTAGGITVSPFLLPSRRGHSRLASDTPSLEMNVDGFMRLSQHTDDSTELLPLHHPLHPSPDPMARTDVREHGMARAGREKSRTRLTVNDGATRSADTLPPSVSRREPSGARGPYFQWDAPPPPPVDELPAYDR